jgi:hypothetical protein
MISFAFTVSGLRFFAKTLITKSRSVMMPIDFPALLVTITHPKSSRSIAAAAKLEAEFSSIVTTGLLITSRTSIFVLNPISDIEISLPTILGGLTSNATIKEAHNLRFA